MFKKRKRDFKGKCLQGSPGQGNMPATLKSESQREVTQTCTISPHHSQASTQTHRTSLIQKHSVVLGWGRGILQAIALTICGRA